MNDNSYKKSILKSALATLVIMVVAFAIFSVVMLLGFTRVSADFVYSLGMDRLASSLYAREYEKSGDLYYCYKSLCVKIKINDNYGIVKTYEKFVADENSADFIANIDSKNRQLNIGVLEMSAMLNEGNYLRNKYINSLVRIGETERAFGYAISDFSNYESYTFSDTGYYSLGIFVNNSTAGFYETPDGYTDSIINCLQDYFDRLYSQFNEHKDTEVKVEKAELIAISYRLMSVGNDINNVYTASETVNPNYTANQDKMLTANDVIKGLL